MGNVLDIPREDYLGRLNLKVMIHVIDSSRPISLTNLFMGGENGNRVLIWDDEDSLSRYKEEKRAWEVIEVREARSDGFYFTYIPSQYEPEPQESDSDSEDDEQDSVYSDEGNTQPEDGPSAHKRKNTARDPAQKRRKLDQGVRLFLTI